MRTIIVRMSVEHECQWTSTIISPPQPASQNMTDHYAVFGNPIAHSKSPLIHAAFARQTGQDMDYAALLAPLDGFSQAVDAFRAGGGAGANVTVPFKAQAYALAQRRTPRAEAAGAVNTLKFQADGILGDNTDGVGLVRDLSRNLGWTLRGRRILLMGAGGAARGVVLPLLEEGPAELFIVNRTAAKAEDLVRCLPGFAVLAGGGYERLEGRRFDGVINATAASLAGDLPPLPEDIFVAGAWAYDMMYGQETPFMAFARARGAQVADGLGMLVEQAAEAFLLWRGVRPETATVIRMLRGG
jgi:shikimate dehydrogenase